jgi:thioesterase domain-containing protein
MHLEVVRRMRPHGPLVLAGHCNGGLVAFEMARQLHARGEPAPLVILIDASARNRGFLGAAVDSIGALAGLTPQARTALQVRVREFRRLSLGRRLIRLLRKAGPVAAELVRARAGRDGRALGPQRSADPDQDLLAVYRQVSAAYTRRRYAGRLVILVPAERPDGPGDLGWQRLAAELEVHVVPGAHLTMLTGHTQALGERLRLCLQSCAAPP